MAPPPRTGFRTSQGQPNDTFSIVDFSDSSSESPCFEANRRKAASKTKKTKKDTPKSKSITTKATPLPKRGLKALDAAASFLREIGSVEDVTDWLDEKGLTDAEVIRNLRRTCTAIADLLKSRASPVNIADRPSESSKALDEYFVYRAAPNSVMLLGTIESIRCNSSYYKNRKVLGFIRRRGEGYPFMIAFPGWKPCAEAHEKVLDSDIWTKYVLQFAKNVGFEFQEDSFDLHLNVRPGTARASHVEPKLLLFFACHTFIKRTKGKVNLKQLHLLRYAESTTEVEIFVSEEPCYSCKKFKVIIEFVTGLKFHFRVCPNLAILKSYRDAHGYKKYPSFAANDSELAESIQMEEGDESRLAEGIHIEEEDEEYERRFPLQLRSPNIMVILRSNISSSNTVKQRPLQGKSGPLKKQSQEILEVPKLPRRKRQYEASDDEDDYEPRRRGQPSNESPVTPAPRTRASRKNGLGLMSPALTPTSGYRYANSMERAPVENVAPRRHCGSSGYGVRRY